MNFVVDESVDRQVVVSFVENHLPELPKAFSVITPGAIRIRKKIA